MPQNKHTLLTLAAMQKIHPEISNQLASDWARYCPALDGPAYTEPLPLKHKRRSSAGRARFHHKLYSKEDYEEAILLSVRTEPLPDEFTDIEGDWIWISALRRSPYKLRNGTVVRWYTKGSPGNNGKPIDHKRRHAWFLTGTAGKRYASKVYVRKAQIVKEIKRRKLDIEVDKNWMFQPEAEKYLARKFLFEHSSPVRIGRKKARVKKPTILPVLGCLIKTDLYTVPATGRKVVRYWRSHITKIVADHDRKLWATRRQVWEEYGIVDKVLRQLDERGTVKTQGFPMPPKEYGKKIQKHFFRADLDAYVVRSAKMKNLPEKVAASKHYFDDDGRWWLIPDVAKMTGTPESTLHGNRLDKEGSIPAPKKVDRWWKAIGAPKVWLFHEDHVNWLLQKKGLPKVAVAGDTGKAIDHAAALVDGMEQLHKKHDSLHGKMDRVGNAVETIKVNGVERPRPVVMPRTPDTGGAEPLSGTAETLRFGILEKYNNEKQRKSLKDFCQDEGITVKTMRGYQAWIGNRIRRRKQSVNKPPVK